MLIVGEVETALLPSPPVSAAAAVRLLALRPGDDVAVTTRPINRAVSPDLSTGLDARLPVRRGAGPRGVGTALTHALITGGQILQSSTFAVLREGESSRRRPWSYYLSRPGTLELLGAAKWPDLAESWLTSDVRSPDFPAINRRLLESVTNAPGLTGPTPFRAPRSSLRWVLRQDEPGVAPGRIAFNIDADGLRTLSLSGTDLDADAAVGFCEDLALHDWLLSTLLRAIDTSGFASADDSAASSRLRPVTDRLLHLWMPAAHGDSTVQPYWEGLERTVGLTRQWNAQVTRIRELDARYSDLPRVPVPAPDAPADGRPRIFISYRTADRSHLPRLLFERINAELPGFRVFYAVKGVKPGADFEEAIRDAIAESVVMLVVIGPTWTPAADGAGIAWLAEDDSVVRSEIRQGLDAGFPIIPILDNNARMPRARDFPADIAKLAAKAGLPIGSQSFDADFQQLREALRELL
ncbi:SCO2521 family protein [Cryptosporangium phraense]|uniref:Toll/interleukin-1 receptor domain-containing protein n=1 Tax=Cryptosporangium phraense TaxID=2593070 RepID=A0A545AMR9_9ACTN|nr:SCO2521 family protein [Cryptosporangium phraense]TQS42573.1 toll/interleukin-1 receptor domain-containing protein [Cryptosporangium phraense]